MAILERMKTLRTSVDFYMHFVTHSCGGDTLMHRTHTQKPDRNKIDEHMHMVLQSPACNPSVASH